MNEQQAFINSVSTIIFWLSLVHLLDAYLCYRWSRLIRRGWLKRLFFYLSLGLAIASAGRMVAYFTMPNLLWLKLGFSYMGAITVVVFSILFAISTYVFERRIKELTSTSPTGEKTTAALLSEVIDDLTSHGRANNWL